ncbi:hypothetical protein [Streptomyces sp. WAC 04229]|uniref:hypothetical protein n=1 Tax=Streptomyces sp. WAC 04229 TaxID=2203206 RepID=UPI003D71E4FE
MGKSLLRAAVVTLILAVGTGAGVAHASAGTMAGPGAAVTQDPIWDVVPTQGFNAVPDPIWD